MSTVAMNVRWVNEEVWRGMMVVVVSGRFGVSRVMHRCDRRGSGGGGGTGRKVGRTILWCCVVFPRGGCEVPRNEYPR
jgi:hypothetical protein